jgi:glycosyltransferase involved in cell wall biosynthesis
METQVRDVLARLRTQCGHEMTWVALMGREDVGELAAIEEPTELIPDAGPIRWRLRGLRSLRARARLVRPNVIHARGYDATLIALGAAGPGVPVIFDARTIRSAERVAMGSLIEGTWRDRMERRLERTLVRRSAATVSVSPPMAQYFNEVSPAAESLVVPLAVDCSRMAAAANRRTWRQRLGIHEDATVVVYSGGLRAPGVEALTSVVKRLMSSSSGVVFLVATRDDSAALVERCEGNILIIRADYEQMPDVLSTADFGLSLIRPESPPILHRSLLGTKFPEYLAAGLGVLVPATSPWLADFVQQRGIGQVFDPRTARPIVLPARTETDRQESRRWAREAFDIGQVADAYDAIYRNVSRS